jgi:hypothetical protein
MCELCVPTCSKPLRVEHRGQEPGRIALLIDEDRLGSVVSVEVDATHLIAAVNKAVRKHEDEVRRRKDDDLVRLMVAGREAPGFAPTMQIQAFADPLGVPFRVDKHPVEVLDGEPDDSGMVSVMFRNGYTIRISTRQLRPIEVE